MFDLKLQVGNLLNISMIAIKKKAHSFWLKGVIKHVTVLPSPSLYDYHKENIYHCQTISTAVRSSGMQYT